MTLSIFKQFFWLGWISFGGPAAHIGYFRQTFVDKLHWLTDEDYAQIVALSQFLPGPGSSQVGFAIGYRKAGLKGAVAAFAGFTLPSVLLMLALAMLSTTLTEASLFEHITHGLKLLAVLVVADAAWGMFKSFCQTRLAIGLCLATTIVLLLIPGIWTQLGILSLAAMIGQRSFANQSPVATLPGNVLHGKAAVGPLLLFVGLLIGLPVVAHFHSGLQLFASFYQAGTLVFGGGHVVLPLLQGLAGEQLTSDAFLTGYAAAQAVPGPMFTLATYLGYQILPQAPVIGALIATAGIFLPGFLLLLGIINNWQQMASHPRLSGALKGINAAVVGLLLAALYQPVVISAIIQPSDLLLVGIGAWLLKGLKLPILALVVFFVCAGIASGLFYA